MRTILRICFCTVFSLTLINAYTQPVELESAKKVAKNYFKQKYIDNNYFANKGQKEQKHDKISNTYIKTYNGHNSYYINNFENGGWVIVAAHRARGPILAYSPSGKMDETNMPVFFWDWMEQYEILIDSAYQKNWKNEEKERKWKDMESDSIKTSSHLKSYTPYTELLTSEWGQTSSSDYYCPGYNDWMPASASCDWYQCYKCAAGCVAVAIAQIMNYWGYATGDYADFNWWDMPELSLTFSGNPNYFTEQSAVAYLLKRCGDRIDMEYCSEGCSSSANTKDADYVFREFGYKDDMNYQRKGWHTYNSWVNMLKDEINAERPVLYRYKGSHTFVCDGHDGDNTFHFNLGWNGDCNGWYDFEDLKSSNCTGSCSNDFDYTDDLSKHHCLIEIRPNAQTSIFLENITISTGASDPWPNKKTYQAKCDINAAGDNSYFEVNTNAECRFVAGSYIKLEPGFHARNGSRFQAIIYKKPTLKSTTLETDYSIDDNNTIFIDDKENIIESSFSIYPNPANDYLILSSNIDINSYIQIIINNLLGKTIYLYTGHFNENHEINIENIPQGVYFIRINYKNNYYIKKFIKE